MKKISIYLMTLILTGTLFQSCTDPMEWLDREETGDLTLEVVYSDIRNADRVLTDLYARLPYYLNNHQNISGKFVQSHMAEAYSVYGNTTLSFALPFAFNAGSWGPDQGGYASGGNRMSHFGDVYTFSFAAIRACLLFLDNIEKVPFDSEFGYGATEQTIKIAEARFLLAWYYYDLLRTFGGVTVLRRPHDAGDDEVWAARNTYDEVVDYIDELTTLAANDLPLQWSVDELGRATKGAALALKAQAFLFSASPLANNPDRPDDSPFRGRYDPTKWNKAAQAAADVIQLGQYSLVNNIVTQFTEYTNPEVIFFRYGARSWHWERSTLPPFIGWNSPNAGRNQATYNFMQHYKVVKDGVAYDQSDPQSGWDMQDPYANLDPRFYRDFAFNGADLRRTGNNATIQVYELGENTTGADAARHNAQSNTYLYNIKLCDLTINPLAAAGGGLAHQNFQFIRYAEILLIYAEAMNEAFGPEVDGLGIGLTALDAINMIRERVKCEPYPEFLGNTYSMPLIPTGLNKEQMRKEIHQERFVELGFEDHLFYDIRRWKYPVESQRTAYLIRPILYRDEPGGERKFRYELVEEQRAFETSWYLMPIPEAEILRNPNIVQNPGWLYSSESDNP